MSFQINVSKNGKHLLTTAENTAESCNEATELYNLLREKFPQEEGYKVDISRVIHAYEGMTDDFEIDYQQMLATKSTAKTFKHVSNKVQAIHFTGVDDQQACYKFIGKEKSRYNGFYDVVVFQNNGESNKLAKEGEWILKHEDGYIEAVSPEDFIKFYIHDTKQGGK